MLKRMRMRWVSKWLTNRARHTDDYAKQVEQLKEAICHAPSNNEAHRLLLTIAKKNGCVRDLLPFYETVAERHPTEALVFNHWGGVYYLLGELLSAQEKYAQAKSLNPSLVAPRSNLALVVGFYGRYDEAIAELEYCLKLNPRNSNVHGNLGLDYQSIGQADKALLHLTRAVELDPIPYRMNVLADFYFQQGDYSRARNWYGQALGKEQVALTMELRHVTTLINMAQCCLKEKDYEQCNQILEQCFAVAGASDNLMLHRKAGEAYLEQRHYEKAVSHFQQALSLAAENKLIQESIYRSLAKTFYMTGEFHRSSAAFELASVCRQTVLGLHDLDWFVHSDTANQTASAQASPHSHLQSAQRLYEQGHVSKALDELLKTEPTTETQGRLSLMIGWIYLLMGDMTRAWQQIFLSIYHLNDSPAPFLLAGMAALYEGSYDQAKFYLHHTLSLDQSSYTAWRLLGHVYGAKADTIQALACYERVRSLSPEQVDIYHSIALALDRQGHPEEALQQLRILLAEQPDHPLGLSLEADLLMKLGREEDAIAVKQRKQAQNLNVSL